MNASSDTDKLETAGTTRFWDELSAQVDAFVSAWHTADEPPKLAKFLSSEDGSLRRLGLVELIKVDLEYRWQKRRVPKLVEEYASEFPELVSAGMLPADLIYEEYHIRKQSGDQPAQDEYRRRFPRRSISSASCWISSNPI